jgi:predicted DNA-binding transcriptional regulator AlpA
MRVAARKSKMLHQGDPRMRSALDSGSEPVQLALCFTPPKPIDTPTKNSVAEMRKRLPDIRLGSMDQRLSTREVVLVVGVNRSTIFRWRKAGRFPQKHKSGGYLRSDIEKWLAEHADDEDFAE